MNLASINEILGAENAAHLTTIIADIKSAVRASDAGVIADKDAEIARLKADADVDETARILGKNANENADLALAKIAALNGEIATLKLQLASANAALAASEDAAKATVASLNAKLQDIAAKGNALRSHLTLALGTADDLLWDDDARAEAARLAAIESKKAELAALGVTVP